ncbi:MAG: hypothetical protein LBH05_04655 [Deferribacteraceae bacterium]|nr:hypothetical protein [Deferribacteraceae bacterium]
MNAFTARLKPYISDWDAFYGALGKRSAKAFRVTGSRGTPYLNEIGQLNDFTPCPNINNTYILKDCKSKMSDTVSFQTGGIYILNPSSVLPAAILNSLMPDNPVILDMSAAPGGKTVILSDLTERNGLIAANEPSASRLKALHFNLEKYGAWNVKTMQYDGRILPKYYADTFDGVLLDAPCSHENQMLLNKKINSRWSLKYVNEMSALQKSLILAAFDCLRQDGSLVYSTCTFSPEENEGVILHLLDNRDNAELINLNSSYSKGISGIYTVDSAVMRIFPHITPYDGFFVAAVRKAVSSSAETRQCDKYTKKDSRYRKLIEEHFTAFPENGLLTTKNTDIYLESAISLKGNFRRTGMKFAKTYGDKTELTSQSVWEFGALIRPELKTDVSLKTAKEYLKGFDTQRTSEYDGRIFYYGGIPVGMVKIIGNTYKNKLNRYFLYGKNIEW